jgi:hypothetical protein
LQNLENDEAVLNEQEKIYTFGARVRKIWILRCVDVPRDVSNAIRRDAGGKAQHVAVHGWIEGLATRGTLVPGGGGRYRFHVHSSIWRKLKIDEGAVVEVALVIERERRETPVPADLAAALADEQGALAEFQSVTPAFRRQTVVFLEKAKQAKTREKRLKLIVRHMLMRAAKKQKRTQKETVRSAQAVRAARKKGERKNRGARVND